MSTPGYRHRASDEEHLMLRSLGELQRELITTSCSYTVGNELAINEIFEVAVLKHIRHGVSSPQYRASMYVNVVVVTLEAISST